MQYHTNDDVVWRFEKIHLEWHKEVLFGRPGKKPNSHLTQSQREKLLAIVALEEELLASPDVIAFCAAVRADVDAFNEQQRKEFTRRLEAGREKKELESLFAGIFSDLKKKER